MRRVDMALLTRRVAKVGVALLFTVVALASPLSVRARSTHDVIRYDRQLVETLQDGTQIYVETIAAKGKHSNELKSVKDWKAYAAETTLEIASPQVAAGFYNTPSWGVAGCKVTAYSGIGPIYSYQLTQDYAYASYVEGSAVFWYIAQEGSTDEAVSTWWAWNNLGTSRKGPYVLSVQTLPTGQRFPYQEYRVGSYTFGHGVTTPWGNIIIESRSGWVKPIYGPAASVKCVNS
jgi:hypothetical protein